MAGVVLVAVLVSASAEGAGSSGPGVAPAVPLSAESLTSKLLSVEVHDANLVLFQANSQYRTYWQVAVLNVLRNGVWVPDPDTENAAHGSTKGAPVTQSGAGAASFAGSRDFTAAVRIDDLSSRILPVPPGTVALSGTSATLTGVGAVSPTPTTSGQQYTTLSAPPVTEPDSLGGNAPVDDIPSRPRASGNRASRPSPEHRGSGSLRHGRRTRPPQPGGAARQLVPLRPVPLHPRSAGFPAGNGPVGRLPHPDPIGQL